MKYLEQKHYGPFHVERYEGKAYRLLLISFLHKRFYKKEQSRFGGEGKWVSF